MAVAGIQPKSHQLFSQLQQEQIQRLVMWDVVWVLDSQLTDRTSREKTEQLLNQDQKVFIWPESLGNDYKDINDYCVGNRVNELPVSLIKENTYSGSSGTVKLKITPVRY